MHTMKFGPQSNNKIACVIVRLFLGCNNIMSVLLLLWHNNQLALNQGHAIAYIDIKTAKIPKSNYKCLILCVACCCCCLPLHVSTYNRSLSYFLVYVWFGPIRFGNENDYHTLYRFQLVKSIDWLNQSMKLTYLMHTACELVSLL